MLHITSKSSLHSCSDRIRYSFIRNPPNKHTILVTNLNTSFRLDSMAHIKSASSEDEEACMLTMQLAVCHNANDVQLLSRM